MKIKVIADKLLNKTILSTSNGDFRICEVEFYLYSDTHKDEYTHKSEIQKTKNKWYFHTRGASYREGTFKGMDMTWGNSKQYLGVLIRSMENILTGEFIEGPCRCVNTIIAPCVKVSEYLNDVKLLPLSVLSNEKNLILKPDETLPYEQMYNGRRYGLSDKYPEWKAKKYRFLIKKNKIKKQKSDLVPVVSGKIDSEETKILINCSPDEQEKQE